MCNHLSVADKNKNEAKFMFQGQYVISQRWLDLDFDWIGLNFIIRKTNL